MFQGPSRSFPKGPMNKLSVIKEQWNKQRSPEIHLMNNESSACQKPPSLWLTGSHSCVWLRHAISPHNCRYTTKSTSLSQEERWITLVSHASLWINAPRDITEHAHLGKVPMISNWLIPSVILNRLPYSLIMKTKRIHLSPVYNRKEIESIANLQIAEEMREGERERWTEAIGVRK